jgi:hypothetical protein
MNPTLRSILKKIFGPAKRRIEADVFWVSRHIVFALDLDRAPETRARILTSFHFGTAADLDQLTLNEHGYDEPGRAFSHRRLAAGDKMALGLHGDEVTFYAWLMFEQMDLGCERLIPISPDRAYSYKVFTSPAWRGRNICPAYYSHVAKLLIGQGYRQLLCHVLSTNEPSLRAHTRAGMYPVGSFWEVRVGRQLRYIVPPKLRRWLLSPEQPLARALAADSNGGIHRGL